MPYWYNSYNYFNTIERPDPPTNINMTSITSRTVQLSWQPGFDGNRDIMFYELYRRQEQLSSSFELVNTDNGINSTTYTITSLEPYTNYQFKVLACNVIGCTLITSATATDFVRTLSDGN